MIVSELFKKWKILKFFQEKMLSKYLFSLNEIIVRMIEGDVATLEIGKLTFADRLIV